jgi:hypothetical protein
MQHAHAGALPFFAIIVVAIIDERARQDKGETSLTMDGSSTRRICIENHPSQSIWLQNGTAFPGVFGTAAAWPAGGCAQNTPKEGLGERMVSAFSVADGEEP